MLRKLLAAITALLLAGASCAHAQQTVVTTPSQRTTQNASSTIAVTNAFQMVFSAGSPSSGAGQRTGCTIQNNGVANMLVTEGLSVAASTAAAAVSVPPGAVYYCSVDGTVLYGQINITGTAADAFYAAQY